MPQYNLDNPPIAPKRPKELIKHGDTRIDPYFWMNQREDPAVVEYLKAENDYTKKVLAHTDKLQEQIFEEMKGRIKQKDESAPYREEGYYYQTRFDEAKEYPVYYRKKDETGAEYHAFLDVNVLAEGKSFYDTSGLEISPSNHLLAFGEDTVSRRIYTLRIKDLNTDHFLNDVIPGTSGSYAWSADNQYIFYTLRNPETLRAYKVMRHKLGTTIEEDVAIFEETDDTFSTYIYQTKSKKYLIIGSYQTISQEYRILEADNPTGEFRLFQSRERDLEHSIAHFENSFYVLTNWDAQNFRLMITPEDQTAKEHWEEVIPHRADVLLEDVDVFKNYLVLSERFQGITRIQVRPKSGDSYYIPFQEEAFLAYTGGNQEYETSTLRLGYQSMTTPPSVFNFSMEDQSFHLLKEQEVLGGFNKEDYQSERIFAEVRDGEKVPISSPPLM